MKLDVEFYLLPLDVGEVNLDVPVVSGGGKNVKKLKSITRHRKAGGYEVMSREGVIVEDEDKDEGEGDDDDVAEVALVEKRSTNGAGGSGTKEKETEVSVDVDVGVGVKVGEDVDMVEMKKKKKLSLKRKKPETQVFTYVYNVRPGTPIVPPPVATVLPAATAESAEKYKGKDTLVDVVENVGDEGVPVDGEENAEPLLATGGSKSGFASAGATSSVEAPAELTLLPGFDGTTDGKMSHLFLHDI